VDIEEAKTQILEAHKVRAIVYYFVYDEMERVLGAETALTMFKKATYRWGQLVQRKFEEFLLSGDLEGLTKRFCESVPSDGELFAPTIESISHEQAILLLRNCPLVTAWRELGLPPERISQLCEAASAVDHGTFETEKTCLQFTAQIGKGDPYCRLIIKAQQNESPTQAKAKGGSRL